jgi:hypothetical protein
VRDDERQRIRIFRTHVNEMNVNTKAAKAMGLAMPVGLLVAADADAMIVLL